MYAFRGILFRKVASHSTAIYRLHAPTVLYWGRYCEVSMLETAKNFVWNRLKMVCVETVFVCTAVH